MLQTCLKRRRREIAEQKEKERKERERKERQRLEQEQLRREEIRKEQEKRKLTSDIQIKERETNGGKPGAADDEPADDISEGSSAARKVREWMKMNEKVEANGTSTRIQREANGFSANFGDKIEDSYLVNIIT